jgi:hypothetical protein
MSVTDHWLLWALFWLHAGEFCISQIAKWLVEWYDAKRMNRYLKDELR